MKEVNKLTQRCDELSDDLSHHFLEALDRTRIQANKHRRGIEYTVGDWVFPRLQPYKMLWPAKRPNQKFCPRFYGPFQILDRNGRVTYKLNLPEDSRIHLVFNVSLPKKAISSLQLIQTLPLT